MCNGNDNTVHETTALCSTNFYQQTKQKLDAAPIAAAAAFQAFFTSKSPRSQERLSHEHLRISRKTPLGRRPQGHSSHARKNIYPHTTVTFPRPRLRLSATHDLMTQRDSLASHREPGGWNEAAIESRSRACWKWQHNEHSLIQKAPASTRSQPLPGRKVSLSSTSQVHRLSDVFRGSTTNVFSSGRPVPIRSLCTTAFVILLGVQNSNPKPLCCRAVGMHATSQTKSNAFPLTPFNSHTVASGNMHDQKKHNSAYASPAWVQKSKCQGRRQHHPCYVFMGQSTGKNIW